MSGGFRVTVNEEGSVSTLQGDGETLEEILYLQSRVLAPTTGILTTEFLKESQSILIPTSKGLYNERLESDAFGLAVGMMSPIL